MEGAPHRRGRRGAAVRPRGWCCSFAGAPQSPDLRPFPSSAASGVVAVAPAAAGGGRKLPPRSPSLSSFHSSPTSSRLAGLGGLIDPSRILSPGRASPIDLDDLVPLLPPPSTEEQEVVPMTRAAAVAAEPPLVVSREADAGDEALNMKLYLRGRDRRSVVMELDSAVLCDSSAFFAAMAPCESDAAGDGGGGKRIEVEGVNNVEALQARWSSCTNLIRCVALLLVVSHAPLTCSR